ncbi:MAG: Fic family protein [Acidobacteriota bacterium]|nr:Fic family protein [Acidobacteriota bacterium]
MANDEKLLCPRDEKANYEIRNQGVVVEYLADFVQNERTRITEGAVTEIHRLTIQDIYPCAGNFRDALTRVEITDTEHQPSHASMVRIDVQDMLSWLYDGDGKARSPIERAAYVMWRTNAIHPFNGGNGRVARALAYLVMVSEVAPVFAGDPLPAILKRRKAEYVAGLKAADVGSLKPLENLVLDCFQQQIASIGTQTRH